MPTDPRVDQLITDALTLAMREEKNGVEMYDYAIAELERSLQQRKLAYSMVIARGEKDNLGESFARYMECEASVHKLSNLREAYITDEFEYMMERAPLKQGDRRDGVVE